MERAVFLDRDGTIIEEVNYLSTIEKLKIYDFSKDAINIFKNLNFKVIVITNQSGISRKFFNEEFLKTVHDILRDNLKIDDFFYCPHLPEHNCLCRKPKTGLIEQAKNKYNINLSSSYFIGDAAKDMQTALNASITPVQVLTGYGKVDPHPEAILTLNLYTAALIIKNLEGE